MAVGFREHALQAGFPRGRTLRGVKRRLNAAIIGSARLPRKRIKENSAMPNFA
jgi:hypothetical protein